MTAPADATATHRLRRWLGGAAGLVVLVLLAASAIQRPAVPLAHAEPASPSAVVWNYLAALRAGDPETALGYADSISLLGASQDLLVPAALSDDWTASRVVARQQDDQTAIVDVTITATDGTAQQGRFWLAASDGGWRILNPLVQVNFGRLPMGFVELNGVTTEAELVWLFPGAYHAYGASDLLRVGAPTYVVAPAATFDLQPDVRYYLPTVELTEAGVAALHDQLRDWIDGCAATGEPFPAGNCPFGAGSAEEGTIYVLDGWYDANGATVSWQVVTYPQVRLAQADHAFAGQLMVPGELRISGTARPLYEDGPEQFASRCTVWLRDLSITMPEPDRFRFDVDLDRADTACGSAQFWH
ncbi:MAG TPA: hypothetical protein VIL37_08070 [Natronosporangium sp.]